MILIKTIKQIYITAFFVMQLLFRAVPIATALPSVVNTALYSLFALFGALLIGWDLVRRQLRADIWLLLFVAVCLVSSLLNFQYGITDNLKTIVWTCIYFFVIYTCSTCNVGLNCLLFLIINFLQVAVSLAQYVLHIGYVADFSQYDRYQGFINNRLFGIFTDPNYAAVLAAISLFISVFWMFRMQSKWQKALLIINGLVQYIFILLTGSRTGLVVCAVILFLSVILFLRKSKPLFKTAVLAVALTAVFLFVCKPVTDLLSLGSEKAFGDNDTHYSLDRQDVTENTDISNSRFAMFKTGFDMFLDRPLFGVSPRNIASYAAKNFPDSIIATSSKHYTTVHSLYVQLPASTGIAGTAVMLVFIIKTLRKIRGMLRLEGDAYQKACAAFIICAAIAVQAALCLDILFVSLPSTTLFWMMLGRFERLSRGRDR